MSDLVGNVFSMLFALIGTICIIILTYFASKWYARRMGPIAGGKHIKVVERLMVSKTGSILIVDIQGRQYLMGVSDQNVEILMELDEPIPFPREHEFAGDGLKGLIGGVSYKNLTDAIKKRRGIEK